MTKTMCISISDWVYDSYLKNCGSNRSQYVEGLIVKGAELQEGEFESLKERFHNQMQSIREKDDELHKLKMEVGRLKVFFDRRKDKRSPEVIAKMDEKLKRVSAKQRLGIIEKVLLDDS